MLKRITLNSDSSLNILDINKVFVVKGTRPGRDRLYLVDYDPDYKEWTFIGICNDHLRYMARRSLQELLQAHITSVHQDEPIYQFNNLTEALDAWNRRDF